MAFEWNFMQPQKIETKLKGMDAVQDSIQAPYTNPYERASYMDAYEADQSAQAQSAQQAMDQKNQRIASLEAQIASLEKSIAEKTAQLQNWSGVDNEIAAIEASKINVADPTMIWRWNRGREDAAIQSQLNREASERANGAVNYEAIAKFKNTSDMLVNTRPSTSTEGIEQQINNLSAAIRDGKNIGADTSALEQKKLDLEKIIYPEEENVGDTGEFTGGTDTENLQASFTDFLNSKRSSKELEKYKAEHRLTDDQKIKINQAIATAKKREQNAADEADFKKFLKDRGLNPDTVSQKIKDSERRTWKALRG
jgi:hypothetical protein